MTNTAQVETLTAEVRVLTIGNKQVTRTMARQLDTCPLLEMELFGRVRIGTGNEVTYIGNRSGTNELVTWDERRITERWSNPLQMTTYVEVEFKTRTDADGTIRVDVAFDGKYEGCVTFRSTGEADEYRRATELQIELNKKLDAARKLPLIVLAGLR